MLNLLVFFTLKKKHLTDKDKDDNYQTKDISMEPNKIIENARKWLKIRHARVNAGHVSMDIDRTLKAEAEANNHSTEYRR